LPLHPRRLVGCVRGGGEGVEVKQNFHSRKNLESVKRKKRRSQQGQEEFGFALSSKKRTTGTPLPIFGKTNKRKTRGGAHDKGVELKTSVANSTRRSLSRKKENQKKTKRSRGTPEWHEIKEGGGKWTT